MQSSTISPHSPFFFPVNFSNLIDKSSIAGSSFVSQELISSLENASMGNCTSWGLPFEIDGFYLLDQETITTPVKPFKANWIVFMHTSDIRPVEKEASGFIKPPMRGEGVLNELAANYFVVFENGNEAKIPIHRRHQIGAFSRRWGENCFQAVESEKPRAILSSHEQFSPDWGKTQTRVSGWRYGPWINWLYAWENLSPELAIIGFRFVPQTGAIVISGVSAGNVSDQPLRWQRRKKAIVTLDKPFQAELDSEGCLSQIKIDLGQLISATPRLIYPEEGWQNSINNQLPIPSNNQVLVEYTCHPDACFHLSSGSIILAKDIDTASCTSIVSIQPAYRRVRLIIQDKSSHKPVPVKLHVHGSAGEYLAPVDRHRIINPSWFEDYSVDFSHQGIHSCTYINGETTLDLPLGRIYLEISKGFEIAPIRMMKVISPETEEIVVEVERILPWREKGWVTADTHVHFLSPISALLEGTAEDVNVVNLLASQWGELLTNVGDYDGKTTWGSREAGGDGEYFVRVGSENRQHILGHISLLGYRGKIIAPMTTGGPDESALGDPVETLLTEWARQCRTQGGLVVLPHFPNPRAEHAASVIMGEVDAIEMTSWEDLYFGIDPYSLSDWYRYLNCGYLVPAVGGTDKMNSLTAVGTVRTYSHLQKDQPFTYETWVQSIRRAETFVSYGPLLEMFVDGHPIGSRLSLPATGGGTFDIVWQVSSVTIPTTRVELIVNGEIRESLSIGSTGGSGSWRIHLDNSSWIALLVRGQYPEKEEMIAAHSSPVMVEIEGTRFFSPADAVSILEQIEGSLAYVDTIGTRASDLAYKRMRLVLVSAYRSMHNRIHEAGYYHDHSFFEDKEITR